MLVKFASHFLMTMHNFRIGRGKPSMLLVRQFFGADARFRGHAQSSFVLDSFDTESDSSASRRLLQIRQSTWCSSAKRENISSSFNHNTHVCHFRTLIPYHSLISHKHSLITMQLEYYEILNSRFALEHRYGHVDTTCSTHILCRYDDKSSSRHTLRGIGR